MYLSVEDVDYIDCPIALSSPEQPAQPHIEQRKDHDPKDPAVGDDPDVLPLMLGYDLFEPPDAPCAGGLEPLPLGRGILSGVGEPQPQFLGVTLLDLVEAKALPCTEGQLVECG